MSTLNLKIIDKLLSEQDVYALVKNWITINIQESFAEHAGLHRTNISAIEYRKRSMVLENIQKIANVLGVETYKLFLDNVVLENHDISKGVR